MGRYRMKAVSRLTGVRPELLRMWERRYHLFKPPRAGNRYREFDDDDVQLLLYIREQIDQGRSIGELAAEGRDALLRQASPGHAAAPPQTDSDLIDELVGYIQRLDKTRLDARLAECVAHYPFVTMLNLVLVPLMQRLGDLWAAHDLSIASERFATMSFKQRLLSLLQATAPGADMPLLLCACPAGELHELGLLSVAYTIQQHGWQVCYLGPDLPLRELRWSCRHLRPTLVALSLTTTRDATTYQEVLHEIDTVLAPVYATVVGGQTIARMHPRGLLHPQHVRLCDTPEAALSCARQQWQTQTASRENGAPTLGKPAIPE